MEGAAAPLVGRVGITTAVQQALQATAVAALQGLRREGEGGRGRSSTDEIALEIEILNVIEYLTREDRQCMRGLKLQPVLWCFDYNIISCLQLVKFELWNCFLFPTHVVVQLAQRYLLQWLFAITHSSDS